MSNRNVHACYVPDTVVYNDFTHVRNGCSCSSKKPHYFSYIYCRRHLEFIENLFSFDVCRKATEICFHNRVYQAACVNCYSYYKFFYLPDAISICLKRSVIDTLLLAYTLHIFGHVDICNFFRQRRKLVQEQQWKSIDGGAILWKH